jgi:hypothetical protein
MTGSRLKKKVTNAVRNETRNARILQLISVEEIFNQRQQTPENIDF